jgi:2-methylisocitrate lyase-like PEP mutase family enzyme
MATDLPWPRAVFRSLHVPGEPLLMPNPWDEGSAKVLAGLGFAALATTSAGFATTLGRLDGSVTRDEALEHSRRIVAATDRPVSADFENGFADDPDDVAENVRLAVATGLAGCSIEDYTGRADAPFYDDEHAVARVAAAAGAAHAIDPDFVVTARCEYFVRGWRDVDATIARLQSFQDAGADVLYAPAITEPTDIEAVVSGLDRPVNVLAMPGVPPVAELAALGVSRVSIGSGFSLVAFGALVDAGRELLTAGTYGFWESAALGRTAVRDAMS